MNMNVSFDAYAIRRTVKVGVLTIRTQSLGGDDANEICRSWHQLKDVSLRSHLQTSEKRGRQMLLQAAVRVKRHCLIGLLNITQDEVLLVTGEGKGC